MMTPSHRARARLIGLPGSLRRDSYSRAVLQAFARSLAGGAELTIRDILLPLYNEDEDGEFASPEVESFRAAIAASDGLVIVTPEYNHGIPGVLKNALDWASRPYGTCSLTDKPVVVMSVSTAFTGGVRAQAQVYDTLLAAQARIVGGPQIVIGNVAAKMVDDKFADQATLDFGLRAIRRMLRQGHQERIIATAAAAG
jgi:chromate reductase, NAD(P)H dehydrogenase (quinone)